MHFPTGVEIIEVGPRDGLQNEKKFVATEKVVEMLHAMKIETGITLNKLSEIGGFAKGLV